MIWGHIYAALTIITIFYVIRKGDDSPIIAILLVAAAWIASNRVDPTNTIANIVIDLVFLFIVYRYWYITRIKMWGILCLITIAQIILHGFSPLLQEWYYLAVRNVLYVSQLPLIGWFAHGSPLVLRR